jgi:glycerate 2-kinase
MTSSPFSTSRSEGAPVAPETPDPAQNPREFLAYLFGAAVMRALPLENTAAWLPSPPRGRTLVLGAGKAAASMVHAVEAL